MPKHQTISHKVDKSKHQTQRQAAFGKGGKTPMAGKGERTRTAATEAAGPQQPGVAGHKTRDGGGRFARGGERP